MRADKQIGHPKGTKRGLKVTLRREFPSDELSSTVQYLYTILYWTCQFEGLSNSSIDQWHKISQLPNFTSLFIPLFSRNTEIISDKWRPFFGLTNKTILFKIGSLKWVRFVSLNFYKLSFISKVKLQRVYWFASI